MNWLIGRRNMKQGDDQRKGDGLDAELEARAVIEQRRRKAARQLAQRNAVHQIFLSNLPLVLHRVAPAIATPLRNRSFPLFGPERLLEQFRTSQLSSPSGVLKVRVNETSSYHWSGKIKIELDAETHCESTLKFRLPGWVREATASVNGEAIDVNAKQSSGYLDVKCMWSRGDAVELDLAMPVERACSRPNVTMDIGRTCPKRGPVPSTCRCHQARSMRPGSRSHTICGTIASRAKCWHGYPRTDNLGRMSGESSSAAGRELRSSDERSRA